MTASAVFTYKRGTSFVQNRYQKKDADKQPLFKDGKPVLETAHGLVGQFWAHGLPFDTIERMDGYMHMKGGQTYHASTIYWHSRYGAYVINPNLGEQQEQKKYNILLHPASMPSHLEGCVTIGFLNTKGVLEDSKACFDMLWQLAGGAEGNRKDKLFLTLVVEGDMPSRSTCSPWSFSG